MLTHSTLGMIRRRWASERPFEGHTSESLERKLAMAPLQEGARAQIRLELQRRGIVDVRQRHQR